jgi:hypothetical protein
VTDDLIKRLRSNNRDVMCKACRTAANALEQQAERIAELEEEAEKWLQRASDNGHRAEAAETVLAAARAALRDISERLSPAKDAYLAHATAIAAARGEKPSPVKSCETCHGKGMTVYNAGADECFTCGGTGKKGDEVMDLEQLKSLRDRVANATGPDRHADTLIAHQTDGWTIKKIGGKPHFSHPEEVPVARDGRPSNYPSYTASIDSALAWVERVLPELHLYGISIVAGNPVSGDWYLYHQGHELRGFISGQTLPLALILAGLDALIAKEKTDILRGVHHCGDNPRREGMG